ncbi:glycoside hydrolase family 88 protein [Dactylosporangium fulvum]|uniref:Glycoside hydrolase family 88 protein n=1 Tax=Dactylosporangium fulvum TaxID=53359 RepID=A0ABY5W4F6_9ACTN|nr:glycoside hydrolase family 88 protein [Dactylosporangium fulvum]UWP84797.1 glycoside hydrolase family 88 protein [Dactylosporangium fulvum]
MPDHPVLLALLAMQRQNWEQGVASHALLDLGLDALAARFARDTAVHQGTDGRLGTIGGEQGAVNSGACYEAVVRAGLSAAAEAQLAWITTTAPRAADGTLFHLIGSREVWADTVYMVVPMLAFAGLPDLAVRQVEGHRRRLCTGGLYAARFDDATGTLVAPEHWGTGSGWVAAGIARAVRLDPALAGPLAGHAREVLDACLAHRRADGLFGNVLDDPASFREANVAQMLAYTAFTGVADGWLPRSYLDTARSLREAVEPLVVDGLVTSVCGAPAFDRPGTSAEAQAFCLLAEAAARRATGEAAGGAAGIAGGPVAGGA